MANTYSLLKPGLKTSLAEALYNEIESNTNNYYYFLGKTLQWDGTQDIVSTPYASQQYEASTREQMIFLKKITSSDISYIIPRYNWEYGKVFDMYDDRIGNIITVSGFTAGVGQDYLTVPEGTDLSSIGIGNIVLGTNIPNDTKVTSVEPTRVNLSRDITVPLSSATLSFKVVGDYNNAQTLDASHFYCIVSNRYVYKCLDNNNGAPSTVMPYGTSYQKITTSDGYVWKYMYTIPNSLVNKFMTIDVIPVTTAIKQQYYSRGTISSTSILNYGQNYVSGDYIVVNGDGYLQDNPLRITNFIIDNEGSGYTSNPTITFADPYNATDFQANTLYVSGQYIKTGSRIYRVEASGKVSNSPPIHTSAEAVYNGTASLKFVGITTTASASITDGAVSEVTFLGVLGYVNITDPGKGYDVDNPPTITISGDGTGAEVIPRIVDTRIVGVDILNRGTGYTQMTVEIDSPISKEITFDPTGAALNLSNNTITSNSHGFNTGDNVIYSTDGETAIGGLEDASNYYVIRIDANTIKLATSLYNALEYTPTNDTAINLTSGATGTTHKITLDVVDALLTADLYYGYGYSTIPSATVSDPFTNTIEWSVNRTVSFDDIISYNKLFYRVTSTALSQNLGATPPIHTSGSETNGEVTLEFIGRTASLAIITEKTNAKITPIITNGQITGTIIVDGGVGYTTVWITAYSNYNGEGADIIANLSTGDLNTNQANIELLAIPGSIDAIKLLRSGTGYSSATVAITGDGSGCTAEAVLENGQIKKINVTNAGSGYTKATVTITGQGNQITPSYARAVVSPPTGHGRNAVKELFAKDISLSTTIAREKNQGFTVNNDYRQIGIVKNPLRYGSTLRYNDFTGSACYVIAGDFPYNRINDDTILLDENGNRFIVISKPLQDSGSSTIALLVQSLDNAYIVAPQVLYIDEITESNLCTVSLVTNPSVDKYSGDLLFIDNHSSFLPTDLQTVSIKTVIRL